MAKNSLQFKILTPEQTVFTEDILEVTMPTGAGEITVLPNHIPLVSTVKTGEIRITLLDGTKHSFAVSSGVVEVQPSSKVVILADRSEEAIKIDIERAEEAYKRAEKAMTMKAEKLDPSTLNRYQALMNKELNRMKVAKKWR